MSQRSLNENNSIEYLRKVFKNEASLDNIKLNPVSDVKIEDANLDDYEFTLASVAEGILNFKDAPYSLENFPFWIDIFNSPRLTLDSEMVDRKMVWKCSRQVGKSVSCGSLASTFSVMRPSFNTIICQPTDRQIGVFSSEILKSFNLESVVTAVWYRDSKKTVRQVKNFGYLNNSRILLANIYNSVLSARGASGDAILIDEFQSIPEEHAIVIERCAARSKYRILIVSGTPLEPTNALQKRFDMSTQNEWMVPCMHCGYWNGPLGGDGSDDIIYNVGKKGLICRKCHRRIYPEDGQWVPAFPDKHIAGYHINELMVKGTSWPSLLYDLNTYSRSKIWNEIFGISYSGDAYPIPLELMVRHCNPLLRFVDSEAEAVHASGDYMFAGLDWAGETVQGRSKDKIMSYTVLNISRYDVSTNTLTSVFVRRYYEIADFDSDSPNSVLTDIIHWLNLFNVKMLGCDYGVGHKENQRIIKELGVGRVMEIQYLGVIADFYEYYINANKWVVSRNNAIEDFIEGLKLGEFEFPRIQEVSEYITDVTNITKSNDALKRVTYGKNGTDDWLHTLIYVMLAQRFFMKSPKFQYKMRKK